MNFVEIAIKRLVPVRSSRLFAVRFNLCAIR
jgi:hypothetical protein